MQKEAFPFYKSKNWIYILFSLFLSLCILLDVNPCKILINSYLLSILCFIGNQFGKITVFAVKYILTT